VETSTVTCAIGSLTNGGSATVTIVVTATQTGSFTNTASVSATEADSTLSNNSASQVTTVNAPPSTLSNLGPAIVWVGQNDAVKQLKFDLLAEVLVNGSVVGSGQLPNVSAGGSDFTQAVLDTVPVALSSVTSVPAGSTLALRLSVRMSCSVKKGWERRSRATVVQWSADRRRETRDPRCRQPPRGDNRRCEHDVFPAKHRNAGDHGGNVTTVRRRSGERRHVVSCAAVRAFGTWSTTLP
jgi:hypothetical protein